MWLKAKALDLEFQLVSATTQLADNLSFCAMPGINPGERALKGCAVSYSAEDRSPYILHLIDEVTSWLE